MSKAETTLNSVTMTDGRIVDFAGKQRLKKETLITDGVVSVRLDFRNGETRTFPIPADLLLQFAGHGAEQKLGDATSGIENIDDAVQLVDELIVRLNEGKWSSRTEGGAGTGASILAKALVEVTGKPVETIRAFLAGKTQQEKLALRSAAELKPVIERLEAERASKSNVAKVDTEALLGDLKAL